MCRLTGTDRHPGTRSATCRGAQTRREAQPQTIPSSHVYARLPTWHIHSHVCDSHTTCPFCLCVHVLFMLISHMGQTGAHSAPSPLSLRSPHALLHCPGWLAGAPSLRRRGASGSSTPPPGPPRWPPGLISAGRRSPRPGGAEEEGHACGRRPKERRCLRGQCGDRAPTGGCAGGSTSHPVLRPVHSPSLEPRTRSLLWLSEPPPLHT